MLLKRWESIIKIITKQTISRYSIRKEDVIGHYKENVEDYDLMEIIVINLGIDDDQENQGILKMLKVLLDGKMETRRKKNILENEFKIRLTQEEEDEVENMCNLSFGLIEEGLELGIKQGKELGIKQVKELWIKQWSEETKRDIIKKMKEKCFSDEEIIMILEITEEEQKIYFN